MRALRFAAIDFETATAERGSACAMALTIVERGRLVDTRKWLIRPPGNEYSPFNTVVHGIKPEDTQNAPEFYEVWGEARDAIADRPLVAHNASFDMSVLRSALDHSSAEWPQFAVYCTLQLSRRVWPGLLSYSVPSLAHFLGLAVERHHDPAADSWACAEIARGVCAATATDDLGASASQIGLRRGSLGPGVWIPCSVSIHSSQGGTSITHLEPVAYDFDPDHPLYGRRVAFTGTLLSMTRYQAAQLVVNAGGQATTSVSKATDYLVFGEQDFSRFVDGQMSTKTRTAAQLIADGHSIEILSEADFLQMIEPTTNSGELA